jgi:hypothetical protein
MKIINFGLEDHRRSRLARWRLNESVGALVAHLDSLHMNNFGLILRSVVWFLFPLPWLLSFAIEHGKDWTAWVAYIAAAAVVLAAVAAGWVATRRGH